MHHQQVEEEPRLLQKDTSFLAIILILFFLACFTAVLSILMDQHKGHGAEGAPRAPSGPADYPDILGQDFTAGLGGVVDPAHQYPVPTPPFTEGIFPCSECHADLDPDPTVRPMEMEHAAIVLRHGGEARWCLDCHDLKDRDKLRLASGTLIPFEESYRLCGQCHGDKYRDWRLGIHGKRTGYWNGPKRYLLCAHCHNPHAPHFEAVKPLAPPVRPEFLRAQKEGGR